MRYRRNCTAHRRQLEAHVPRVDARFGSANLLRVAWNPWGESCGLPLWDLQVFGGLKHLGDEGRSGFDQGLVVALSSATYDVAVWLQH